MQDVSTGRGVVGTSGAPVGIEIGVVGYTGLMDMRGVAIVSVKASSVNVAGFQAEDHEKV